MDFFSRSEATPTSSQSSMIPADIVAAVSVMGSHGSVVGERTQRQGTGQSQGTSPFFSGRATGEPSISQPTQATGPAFQKSPEASLKVGSSVDISPKPRFFQKKKAMLGVLGGVTGLLLLGGATMWYLKYFEEPVPAPVADVSALPSESPVSATVSMLPYAPETANYLSLDTENITTDSFGEIERQAGEQIVAAGMTKPVEFLLTDKNNNPIAFSRFAYLMNLGLPEALLATLGESFSLFVYNDNGDVRFGLGLTLADPQEARKLILQSEKGFPFFFRSVLFRGVTVPREVSFRSGVYNGEPVRFVNIDAAQNVSCDFIVREKNLYMGTSKETLRAILNKRQ